MSDEREQFINELVTGEWAFPDMECATEGFTLLEELEALEALTGDVPKGVDNDGTVPIETDREIDQSVDFVSNEAENPVKLIPAVSSESSIHQAPDPVESSTRAAPGGESIRARRKRRRPRRDRAFQNPRHINFQAQVQEWRSGYVYDPTACFRNQEGDMVIYWASGCEFAVPFNAIVRYRRWRRHIPAGRVLLRWNREFRLVQARMRLSNRPY